MADLIAAYAADNTLTNVGANFEKFKDGNGLGGRTIILSLAKTDITHAELATAIDYITSVDGDGAGALAANGSDAFTVVAIDGFLTDETADVVYLAVQGTGTLTKAGIEANDGSIGFTATILADFAQNPA